MQRKRWTKKEDNTPELEALRAKRKWQIALRRYILENQKCYAYAPFFGVSSAMFRSWIELQFGEELTWENFSKDWQLDHIVPVAYFDFKDDRDMKLCWNYLNIRPEKLDQNKNRLTRVDLLAAKAYFSRLHEQTSLSICREMVQKIENIEQTQMASSNATIAFLQNHSAELETMTTFDAADFERLNTGTSYTDLAFEKSFFKKFA